MFDRPESSLTRMRRSLPTDSGVDVFVAVGDPGDGVNVHAAFVGEGALADERLVGAVVHVRQIVDIARQLGEPLRAAGGRALRSPFFDGQIGADGNQIGVAAAFADAVDRALHLHRAGIDGGQRIGDGQIAIVVAVNADGHVGRAAWAALVSSAISSGIVPPLVSHRTTRLAPASAAARMVLRGVFGIELPAVEEMFGIVDDFAAGIAEVFDRFARSSPDFLPATRGALRSTWKAEVLPTMVSVLAPESSRAFMPGSCSALHAFAAGHAEGADPGVLQVQLLNALKELGVLFVREGIAAFDEIEAELVEPLGDEQLVLQREVDAFALAAVAERGVVDLDAHGWVVGRLASGRLVSGGFENPGTQTPRHPATYVQQKTLRPDFRPQG